MSIETTVIDLCDRTLQATSEDCSQLNPISVDSGKGVAGETIQEPAVEGQRP